MDLDKFEDDTMYVRRYIHRYIHIHLIIKNVKDVTLPIFDLKIRVRYCSDLTVKYVLS